MLKQLEWVDGFVKLNGFTTLQFRSDHGVSITSAAIIQLDRAYTTSRQTVGSRIAALILFD